MTARRTTENQRLADSRHKFTSDQLTRMLTYIANLRFPDEERSNTDPVVAAFRKKHGEITVKETFELWNQKATKGKQSAHEAAEVDPLSKMKPMHVDPALHVDPWPPLKVGQGFGGVEMTRFLEEVRQEIEMYWPELWEDEPDQEPPDVTLRRMRNYLRRFWRADDKRSRDWYVFRAREYYQRRRVLRALADLDSSEFLETGKEGHRAKTRTFLREQWRKASTINDADQYRRELDWQTDGILDEAPPRTPFEDALFELQERADIRSKRPLYCSDCTRGKPYFLSKKKGSKYCSNQCSRAHNNKNKRSAWQANKDKWRKK